MTNLKRSNFQDHPFHLISPFRLHLVSRSPLALYTNFSLFPYLAKRYFSVTPSFLINEDKDDGSSTQNTTSTLEAAAADLQKRADDAKDKNRIDFIKMYQASSPNGEREEAKKPQFISIFTNLGILSSDSSSTKQASTVIVPKFSSDSEEQSQSSGPNSSNELSKPSEANNSSGPSGVRDLLQKFYSVRFLVYFFIVIFYTIAFKYPMLFMINNLGFDRILFSFFCAFGSCCLAFVMFELFDFKNRQKEEFTFNKLVYIFCISLSVTYIFPPCVLFIWDGYIPTLVKSFLIDLWYAVWPIETVYAQSPEQDDPETSDMCCSSSDYYDSDDSDLSGFRDLDITNKVGLIDGVYRNFKPYNPEGPWAVSPKNFNYDSVICADSWGIHNVSMGKLLNNIFTNMFPGVGWFYLNLNVIDDLSDRPSYFNRQQPWYNWLHTQKLDYINDSHTLKCLLSKIEGHITLLSQQILLEPHKYLEMNDYIIKLSILHDLCEAKVLEFYSPSVHIGHNTIGVLFGPRSGKSIAKAIELATKPTWVKAVSDANEAKLNMERAKIVGREAARIARIRNAIK